MALRTSRVVRKYVPFYSRVRDSEGSDSEGMMRPGGSSTRVSSSSSSFGWLQRAFSTGFSHAHVVPLSESPKRELRMRTRTRRQHHDHSKKHKKHFPRLRW